MRSKMDPANRAKQFMPFAALKGYEEALRRKEKILVEKVELAEEYQEELNWQLRSIEQGSMVTVTYYQEGGYVQLTGLVSQRDVDRRKLRVVNTPIAFEDICQIVLQ